MDADVSWKAIMNARKEILAKIEALKNQIAGLDMAMELLRETRSRDKEVK